MDVSIECDTDEHSSAQFWAWAAITIYPIGILVFYAVVMLSQRLGMVRPQANIVITTVTDLFQTDYRDSWKGWELVVMGQQLLLAGFLILVSRTT